MEHRHKHRSYLAPLLLTAGSLALGLGCGRTPDQGASSVKVTEVPHTAVKRQAIGNCWLYAQATWLEAKLRELDGTVVDVSESYWTYWDFYHKLLSGRKLDDDGTFPTGGTWSRSVGIVKAYGWVHEKDFISGDTGDNQMSQAQACAESYLTVAMGEGGSLADTAARTPELIKQELNKAFSCDGRFTIDIDKTAAEHGIDAETTMLKERADGSRTASLSDLLDQWTQNDNPAWSELSNPEGKKLLSTAGTSALDRLGRRVRRALNDHQPVVLSFFVTFNAPDDRGLFNLSTLAATGQLGHTGGHMVVFHDYTVRNVNGGGALGEGDLSDAEKALALTGDIEYLVAKNSWGADRPDRPWLRNGYSRFTWDYLSSRYLDEEDQVTRPFLQQVVLPPGY